MAKNKLQQIFSAESLAREGSSYLRAIKSSVAGVDGVTARSVLSNPSEFTLRVARSVREGAYQPKPLLGIPIEKPNGNSFRMICVPTVEDRLVQRLLHHWMISADSRAGSWLKSNTVAYGIGRGRKSSVEAARDRALQLRRAHPVVYKVDITKYFDRIPREQLKRLCHRVLRCPSLNSLIDQIIDTEIGWYLTRDGRQIAQEIGIKRGSGLRQGMPISPILAALYLKDFDVAMQGAGFKTVRYVDDIAVFLDSKAGVEGVDSFVREKLGKLGLEVPNLGDPKCESYDPGDGVDFLGMEIVPDGRGGYRLEVPDRAFNRVEEKLLELGSLENALKKGWSIADLGKRLRDTRTGFENAYSAASNHEAFAEYLKDLENQSMRSLLAEAIGEDAVRNMSRDAQKFFGLR